ncbi:MAG: glycosyltransferase [Lachnospiraceae bacterium]|nr:glycosyltransferase [Lachnospiraceae bacterium]
MSTKISVITVCFNAASELPVTIESVLAQDYTDYEYIIQDGNSTDSTDQVVEGYRKFFDSKNIKLTYNKMPDDGIYDAMNKAVACAEGDYINFMNAGDSFYNAETLSSVIESLSTARSNSEQLPDIIYGDCAVYEYGVFYRFNKSLNDIEEAMPFSHQSTFARRDLLIAHPFKTCYRYSADYDFLLTMHDLGRSFHDSNCLVCITNADGVSSVNYHDTLVESALILKDHGKYHHSDKELKKDKAVLKIKQFVMDYFPDFIKKTIRLLQIKSRGQKLNIEIPPWYVSHLTKK